MKIDIPEIWCWKNVRDQYLSDVCFHIENRLLSKQTVNKLWKTFTTADTNFEWTEVLKQLSNTSFLQLHSRHLICAICACIRWLYLDVHRLIYFNVFLTDFTLTDIFQTAGRIKHVLWTKRKHCKTLNCREKRSCPNNRKFIHTVLMTLMRYMCLRFANIILL